MSFQWLGEPGTGWIYRSYRKPGQCTEADAGSHSHCPASKKGLELLLQTGLFQYTIRRVTRFDLVVHGKSSVCDGAVPDFVVSLARAFLGASRTHQDAFQLRGEIGH